MLLADLGLHEFVRLAASQCFVHCHIWLGLSIGHQLDLALFGTAQDKLG